MILQFLHQLPPLHPPSLPSPYLPTMTSPVILLTGASRGIGLSVAHFLLSTTPTARLILAARSTTSLSALHEQYPDRTSFITADFSLSGEGKKVVQYALDTYGRLDALCVVHGVLDPVKRLEDAVGEEWGRAVQIGLVAVVEMVSTLLYYTDWDANEVGIML